MVFAKNQWAWKAAQPSAKFTTKSALSAVPAERKSMGNFLSGVINPIVTNVMPKSRKLVANVSNLSKAIASKPARNSIIPNACVVSSAMTYSWGSFSFMKISQFAKEITR